jgi:hypothetical protein
MDATARRVVALIAGACLAACASAPAAAASVHRADGDLSDWHGRPTMLGGRTQISGGELIYTDYLYDDYGPDLNGHGDLPQFRDELAPKAGDYGYPDNPDRYGYNAADLRELRIAADSSGLHALIALQTMKVADATVATIAIDTDGKSSTGAAQWPEGLGLDTPGADRFITVWGAGGRVTDSAGHSHVVHQAVNLRDNAIEVDVPWKLLGKVSDSARVWVVTGLATPGGHFLDQGSGGTPAFDAGFQGAEEYDITRSHWSDLKQAKALADGDISALSHRLDLPVLEAGGNRHFRVRPGFYDRIFRSRFSYGEGISLKTSNPNPGVMASGWETPEFRGRYQPYGLWIPKGYRRGRSTPLTLAGHSLDVNLNEYRSVAPNHFYQELGDDRHSLVVTPLARGMDTWYLTTGFEDVLEVLRDVRRHYGADPDRTAITGYSMGGYMTYRLGYLMPDLFTRASVYVGPPAYFHWAYPAPPSTTPPWTVAGQTNNIVDNGLDLPFEINHGDSDELVPISGVVHQTDTIKAAGDPYRFYHHTAPQDHLLFIFHDAWTHTRDWLGNYRRNLSPVRVRYKRYPVMDLPKYKLRFDGAYWVDAMALRNAAADDSSGEVDAITFALGGNRPRLEVEPETVSPGEGGNTPATVTGQHIAAGKPIVRRNAFEATLTNLRRILFRSDRMGLNTARVVRATLHGDGDTILRFTGRWPCARPAGAKLDGDPVAVVRDGPHAIRVDVDLSGPNAHHLVLGANCSIGASSPGTPP